MPAYLLARSLAQVSSLEGYNTRAEDRNGQRKQPSSRGGATAGKVVQAHPSLFLPAEETEALPEDEEDVKEGHFAVVAVWDEKPPNKFVVSLSCLSRPVLLLRLLRLPPHTGAIAIPCRAHRVN